MKQKTKIKTPLLEKTELNKEVSLSNKPIKNEEEEIKEVINHFRYLEEPMDSNALKKAAIDTFWFIPKSTVIGLAFSLTPIQNAVGFFILNHNGETVLQGSFGVYTMFRNLLFTAFFHAIALRMSISASQCFGGGADFAVGKKYFTQAFLLFLLHFVLIYYPFITFCEEILTMVNIGEDIANGFKQIAVKCLVNDFFDVTQQFIMEYCYSQNIESVFSVIGWCNMGVSLVVTLVLSFTFDYGFDGFIIGRTFYYFLNIVAFLFIYYTKTSRRSRGFVTITEALDGFREFLVGSLGFYLGNVFEWIGWELGIYINALSHDNSQIAAFGSLVSMVAFIYHYGLGFLVVGRTRMNYLLGGGFPKAAKRVAAMIVAAACIASVFTGILLYLVRRPLANLYSSSDPDANDYLVRLLALFAIGLFLDLNYSTIVTIMRTSNHVLFCAVVSFGCCFILNGSVCVYMRANWDITCIHIFISMYTAVFLSLAICFIKGMLFDWSKVTVVGGTSKEDINRASVWETVINPKVLAVRSKMASVMVQGK